MVQSEGLRALGQMASGVAHDLNQYLGLVAGHGELALRSLEQSAPDLEGLRDALRIVVQAAMDGAHSVQRLQAFARPRSEGARERVELGPLLHEVAGLTAPHWRDTAQAEGRPIDLQVDSEGDTAIDGWPASLREALTNLVFNAVDALPTGGQIRLAVRRRGERVEAEVADSGIGMGPEVQARAFEPFFSTKGERGTGLGLSMVCNIVERHGGEIVVNSEPGRGTTVRLSLPAAGPGQTPPPAEEQDAPSKLGILVVEDDPALAQMAALMLQSAGHVVDVAGSGEEALHFLAATPYDVVLSDLGLGGGMNGWELAQRVRKLYPGVRFVLATGWGAQITDSDARQRGVDAVLAKPYRLADFRRLLSELDV